MKAEVMKRRTARKWPRRNKRTANPEASSSAIYAFYCGKITQSTVSAFSLVFPHFSAFFRITPTAPEIGPSRLGDIRRIESPPVASVEQASGLYHSASLSAKAALAAADGRIAGSEGHRAGRPPQQAGDLFHPRKNPSGSK